MHIHTSTIQLMITDECLFFRWRDLPKKRKEESIWTTERTRPLPVTTRHLHSPSTTAATKTQKHPSLCDASRGVFYFLHWWSCCFAFLRSFLFSLGFCLYVFSIITILCANVTQKLFFFPWHWQYTSSKFGHYFVLYYFSAFAFEQVHRDKKILLWVHFIFKNVFNLCKNNHRKDSLAFFSLTKPTNLTVNDCFTVTH